MLAFYILYLGIALYAVVQTAEILVKGGVRVARLLHASPLVIGVFILGFGSSLPELVVSVGGAVAGDLRMAVANAVGSNTTNIALVLGLCFLLKHFAPQRAATRSQMMPVIAACALPGLLLLDLELTRSDGLILLAGMALCLFWVTRAKQSSDAVSANAIGAGGASAIGTGAAMQGDIISRRPYLVVALSLGGLLLSAQVAVLTATEIAIAFGVGTEIIGLTILAIGTSLPELAASVASVRNRQSMLAVGNIVGSLIFNILFVNGVAVLIHPDILPEAMLVRDTSLMLGLVLVATPFLLFLPRLNLLKGILLLAVFFVYESMLYFKDAILSCLETMQTMLIVW